MAREVERIKAKQSDRRELKLHKEALFKKACELKAEVKKRDKEWRGREQALVDQAEADRAALEAKRAEAAEAAERRFNEHDAEMRALATAELERSTEAQAALADSLGGKISALEGSLAEARGEAASSAETAALKAQGLVQNLHDLEKAHDQQVEALAADKSTLASQLSEKSSQLEASACRVEELIEQMTKATVTHGEASLALRREVEAATASLREAEQQKHALATQLESKEADMAALTSKHASELDTARREAAEKQALAKQVEGLTESKSSLAAQLEESTKQLEAAADAAAELKRDNEKKALTTGGNLMKVRARALPPNFRYSVILSHVSLVLLKYYRTLTAPQSRPLTSLDHASPRTGAKGEQGGQHQAGRRRAREEGSELQTLEEGGGAREGCGRSRQPARGRAGADPAARRAHAGAGEQEYSPKPPAALRCSVPTTCTTPPFFSLFVQDKASLATRLDETAAQVEALASKLELQTTERKAAEERARAEHTSQLSEISREHEVNIHWRHMRVGRHTRFSILR